MCNNCYPVCVSYTYMSMSALLKLVFGVASWLSRCEAMCCIAAADTGLNDCWLPQTMRGLDTHVTLAG